MGRINWNTEEYSEGRKFLALVETAEWRKNEMFGGEQLALGYKPLDHQIKGPTGCYWEWFGESGRKTSKMYHLVENLKKMGLKMEGDGTELVGHIFVVEEVTLPFTVKDKETDQEKEVKAQLPTEYYGTDEAEALAKWKEASGQKTDKKPVVLQKGTQPKPLGGMKAASTPAAKIDWKPLMEALKNGLNKAGLQRWAQRNKVSNDDLNAKMTELEEAEKLDKEEAAEGNFVLKEE